MKFLLIDTAGRLGLKFFIWQNDQISKIDIGDR